MNDVVAVRIPQENVNDDVVTLLAWRVRDGAAVEADQVLAEVEGSKAAFEVASPTAGVVRLVAPEAREMPVGQVLCYVGPSQAAIDRWLADRQPKAAPLDRPDAPPTTVQSVCATIEHAVALVESTLEAPNNPVGRSRPPAGDAPGAVAPDTPTTRFSRHALALLREQGLREADFDGRGLVRARDLALPRKAAPAAEDQAADAAPRGAWPVAAAEPRGAAGVPVRTQRLPRAKLLEGRLLAWGARHALRSAVVATVATAGRHSRHASQADAAELRSARLIAHCGRLLRQYPHFNAYCAGDNVHVYEQVNVGYALDAGRGLKVPVFRNADQTEVPDIVRQRRRFIDDYAADRLTPHDLAGGTFSITDLSGSGVFLFDPLIVEGQSAILGVGGSSPSAGAAGLAYNLILAFDHRLIEGRAAARFLNELRENMLAFELGEAGSAGAARPTEPCCAQCGMALGAASARKHFLVQVADSVPGSTRWLCTICLQGR